MCHVYDIQIGLGNIHLRSTPAIPHRFGGLGRNIFNSVSLDPNCCTGLSFFLRYHEIVDIHAHSTRYPPTHVEKFKYLEAIHASGQDDGLEWIYMPLTAQDAITAVRARRFVDPTAPHYFTVRKKNEMILNSLC